jgi:hypothetical protein
MAARSASVTGLVARMSLGSRTCAALCRRQSVQPTLLGPEVPCFRLERRSSNASRPVDFGLPAISPAGFRSVVSIWMPPRSPMNEPREEGDLQSAPNQTLGPAERVAACFAGSFQSHQVVVHKLEVQPSGEIRLRFTLEGIHTGDFMGISPTGAAVSIAGSYTFQELPGGVRETWSGWNPLALREKLDSHRTQTRVLSLTTEVEEKAAATCHWWKRLSAAIPRLLRPVHDLLLPRFKG